MPPSVSTDDFRRVTPRWLRPAALAVVTCVHFVVLFGVPWPSTSAISIPRPVELQVIPQGRPVEALAPVGTQQATAVPASEATPSATAAEAQAVATAESPATAPPEQATVNPAERPADIAAPTE